MTKARNIVLTGFILSSILPNIAAAQSACDCTTGSSATVTSVNGDVTTSGAFGFSAGEPGQVLTLGGEVYTGADSSANLSFGSQCNIQLGPQSKAVFIPARQGSAEICAQVERQAGVAEASTAAAPALNSSMLGILAGVGVIAGGVYLISASDSGSNSISK